MTFSKRLLAACALPCGLLFAGTLSLLARAPGSPLDADTEEGRIAQLNTFLLENAQLSHRGIDDVLSERFLNLYLDALDGSHELFLKSDVVKFEKSLPGLKEGLIDTGDTKLAHLVFDTYLKRSQERADYVAAELRKGAFDFTGDDRYSYDRREAPRPADKAAAQELWKQRLRADLLQEKLDGKEVAGAKDTVAKRYHRQAEMTKNLGKDAVLETYMDALAHVYDPHSDYMGKQELEDFNIMMKLSLAGVGASLSSEGDYCKVESLVPGGPAELGGELKAGDRITAVAQGADGEPVDLFNLPLREAVKLIRGEKGTDVTLTVIPVGASDDMRKDITIRRDEIHFEDQEARAEVVDLAVEGKTTRVGVIDLPGFYGSDAEHGQSASEDVAKLVGKLKKEKVAGLVLDLRRNGGGSLQEAVSLAGLFIPSGAVVQTKDGAGHVEWGEDIDGKALYTGPLVVLTSRFSASASEIVAGALKDYGRALIVGDSSTFGKGTVQTILPLEEIMKRNGLPVEDDPGVLKVTISKFYRPGGASTQLKGVASDIVLPSLTDTAEISEASMKFPLEWDSIGAADFPQFDLVKPFVAELTKKSQARIAEDEDFKTYAEDIATARKNETEKSISLNEEIRRKERAEMDERNAAREAKELARPADPDAKYEITLKNFIEPGLPEAFTMKEGEPVPPDLLMKETQRILGDYIVLLAEKDNAAAQEDE